MLFVSTQKLVNEACDEKRFAKAVGAVLQEVRNGVHDGLFTAHAEEPNWGIAHRVLMPAFGPTKIQSMFDEMHDIASQLAMKWARHGPSAPINASDDFTRLTLDTLALCAMDYRFNSYYHDDLHPFIEAMGDFLIESGNRSRRPPFTSIFYKTTDERYQQDIELLRETAHDVLKARKASPTNRKDLLTAMLEGVDPKTGQKLSDNSIVDNLITFLIAGHETTSGLLSFAFYNLLKHPEAYRKAQQEVDDVIGQGPVKVEHMGKLHYIAAILRETLRLSATIPIIGVQALQEDVLAGKYPVKKGQNVLLLLAKSHLDPEVYGETAKDFIPERMLDENFERLNKEFPNCWKPFGNGMRACIGRPFAWQEALLVMAMLLQNFNFMPDDPNYNLQIKQTLTIKPKNFFMRASLRHGLTPTELEHALSGDKIQSIKKQTNSQLPNGKGSSQPEGKPMSIYYGSNTGTCESLAQRLASDAPAHGFHAATVEPLDAGRQNLPKDQPVVIITASYEGQPPDNAGLFVNWVENLKAKELENVSYSVFGCGHRDWASTFHRIPKLVDTKLEAHGASRIVPLGVTDASQGNMFTDFETWEDESFWPAMAEKYGVATQSESDIVPSGLSIEMSTPRSSTLRQDVKEAIVQDVKTLTAPEAPVKKHIEIQLPSDARYTAGDYLAILPLNPKETIHRAMRRFQLAWDTHITISAQGRTTLPTNISIPVNDVLGAYVELAQPATKRSILSLVEAAKHDEVTREQLKKFATDNDTYNQEISSKRVSILDLLERFPTIALPFSTFLSLLPPMRVRQYSISSSPLWNPSRVTLTYSVLDAPALAGGGRHHVGVASSYLASLETGDKLHVSVRPSHTSFHLPVDAEKTPIILIAAGTGMAPFRGFIQERAAQIAAGRTLAPALLFFGCRDPKHDDLYREEMDRWEKLGAVDVRRAFSRSDVSEAKGCKYVQDRLWLDREEVGTLWKKDAKVYICGSRKVGDAVKQVIIRTAKEIHAKEKGTERSDEEVAKWLDGLKNERFATDVFD